MEYYNSAITVNPEGETIANYRKTFLYYTDETWALEGQDGFYGGEIDGLGKVAMGICECLPFWHCLTNLVEVWTSIRTSLKRHGMLGNLRIMCFIEKQTWSSCPWLGSREKTLAASVAFPRSRIWKHWHTG